MANLVQGLAVACGGAMAIVGRLLESADDRRERDRQGELNRLWQQAQGERRCG